MNDQLPSFFARISIAFKLFFQVLANPEYAARAVLIGKDEPIAAARPTTPAPPKQPSFKEAQPEAAIQLLGLLQQEGRFIDFLEEDVTSFSDSDIGAAARVVHEGCRKAVRNHFKITPIRAEAEGSKLTLQEGFDPSSIRLAGNVIGKPPYCGNLIHRGWRVSEVKLPKVAEGHDVKILAAAEVEL